MNYSNGKLIKPGDRVKLSDGSKGMVVFSVDTNEYTESYNEKEWSYLKKGIMIKSEELGLVHVTEENENIVQIEYEEKP